MSRILFISLNPELTRATKERAKEERRSVSEVTREAVKRYLEISPKKKRNSGVVSRRINKTRETQ